MSLPKDAAPAAYTWLWQDAGAEWQAFRHFDQARLEAAEEEVVDVEGGRCRVDLKERRLRDNYGSDPPRKTCPVRRSLWFAQVSSSSSRVPYDEKTDQAIETLYQQVWEQAAQLTLSEGAKVSETVVLDSGRVVRIRLEWKSKWRLTCEERPKSSGGWLADAQALLEKVYQLQRGFGDVPMQPGEAEEEKLGKDIGNVIILVHGIGEKMWSEEGCGLAASTGSFRRMVQVRQLETAGFVQKGGHWTYPGETPPKLKKDEVLEASWWESVHTDEMDTRLARITLPSMKQVRQIANFAVVDALYYLQVGRKEKIIAAVARSVETALQRFRAHHPQHEGAVVLAGHSLGGAILFELLRSGSAQLSFTPQALFTMGSPTGLFMHCADALPSPDFELPGTRFYNIFHPLDPVAYRIEPLIAEQLDKLDPAKVPVEGAWGGMKAHHGVQQLMNWASGEEKKQSELLEICRALKLNAGERVDWVLQEDLTFLNAAGVAGELLQALPSHSCYMKSADVAGFVQSRTANIMLAKGVLKRDPTSPTANLGTPVPSLAPAVASPAPDSEAEPCPAKEPVAA